MGAIEELIGWLRRMVKDRGDQKQSSVYPWEDDILRRHGEKLLGLAEAELVERGEERVVVLDPLETEPVTFAAICHEDEPGGMLRMVPGERYAFRRLSDEPKPVAVYERPWLRALQCSVCGYPLNTFDLGGKCGNVECGLPLASTASPWPGNQAKGEKP